MCIGHRTMADVGASATGASVVEHYQRVEDVVDQLTAALKAAGLDPRDPESLAGAEEFHLGGRASTDALFDAALADGSGTHLDIGSGVGGTARRVAVRSGRSVVGVDLTPSFVAAAGALSEQVGLSGLTSFDVGDATDLDFADGQFGSASMLHVGMNIADKGLLAAGVYRVLGDGSPFVVYDVMRVGDGEISYPMPWASSEADSFVERPADYRGHLEAAGFEVESVTDRSEAALRAGAEAAANPPPVNIGHLMGRDFGSMIANLVPAVKAGILAPIEIVARR